MNPAQKVCAHPACITSLTPFGWQAPSRCGLVVPIDFAVGTTEHDLPGLRRDMSVHPRIVAPFAVADVFHILVGGNDGGRVEVAELPPGNLGSWIQAIAVHAGLNRLGDNAYFLAIIRGIAEVGIIMSVAAITLPPG